MEITDGKTDAFGLLTRRSNAFFACAVSSLLLAMAPFAACRAQTTAQTPAAEPATKAAVTAAATPTIDATALLLKDIEASVYRDRTISDDDLAFVLQFARTPGVDQLAAYNALAPLSILWTRRISESQYATFHKYIMETLLADDKLTDHSGLQKACCLSILARYGRQKAMRPIVENLQKDPRPSVSKTAVILSSPSFWDKLKD